jgi:hypothetical protein
VAAGKGIFARARGWRRWPSADGRRSSTPARRGGGGRGEEGACARAVTKGGHMAVAAPWRDGMA